MFVTSSRACVRVKNSVSRLWFPLLTAALFSGSYIGGKYTTVDVDPVTVTLMRYVIAGLFLLCLAPWLANTLPKLRAKSVMQMALLGFFGIFGYNVLFFLSLGYTEVANTAIINATSPVITGVLACLVLRERLSTRVYLGGLVTVLGVLILLTDGQLGLLLDHPYNRGDLYMLMAVVCWAVYAILIKRLSDAFSAYALTLYATVAGVVWLLLAWLLFGDALELAAISSRSYAAIVYMGIIASGIGYLTYNHSVSLNGATVTSGLVYGLVPPIVAVLAWMLLAQRITWVMTLSTFLIIIGVWQMLRRSSV